MAHSMEDTELLHNILYHLTDGQEGVQTIPGDLVLDAIRVQIKKGLDYRGSTPAPYLKPSQGDALQH